MPHAARDAFKLATGKKFVPKSALFAFEEIDLICNPLSRTTNFLQPQRHHRQCLDFLQSGTLRNASRSQRIAKQDRVDSESETFQNRPVERFLGRRALCVVLCHSAARCHTAFLERMMLVDNRQLPHDHCSVTFLTKGHQPSRCPSNPQAPRLLDQRSGFAASHTHPAFQANIVSLSATLPSLQWWEPTSTIQGCLLPAVHQLDPTRNT